MSDMNQFYLNTYINNILLKGVIIYYSILLKSISKQTFRCVLMALHICNTPI